MNRERCSLDPESSAAARSELFRLKRHLERQIEARLRCARELQETSSTNQTTHIYAQRSDTESQS